MPRVSRKSIESSFLHIMVQGINGEYIFYKKEYIEEYMKIINKHKELYNIVILAYCIMNNHAHFLLYVENKEKLGKFMQKTSLIYAQKYNKKEKRRGVLFRNRYKSEPIYDTGYLINCIKYIHNNPVKAKMVLRCEDYPYSSYKDYINNEGLSRSKIMIKMFGEKCDYKKLFNVEYERRYIDADEDEIDIKGYIIEGTREYKNKTEIKIEEIFSNRHILKALIKFLHIEYKIKYIEIGNFFEIPRGIMDRLKTQ